jgi:hypothetical protein
LLDFQCFVLLEFKEMGTLTVDGKQPTIPKSPVAGVGHKRILMLAVGSPLLGLRLVVDSDFAVGDQLPALRSMELFDWGGSVEDCV